MSKIKEIHERFMKNPVEYSEIRLLIAKRTLSFFIALYFLCVLFGIGGFSFGPFSLDTLARITYHSYTILIIVVGWFIYELSLYGEYFFGNSRIIRFVGILLGIIFICGNLGIHIFM